jgi:hypothetical protein
MKELGLQDLLRYALAGGIGLAVLLLTFPGIRPSIRNLDAAKEATLVLGLVLLIGTLIYNLHRGLLFPVLHRLLVLILLRRKFSGQLLGPWRPSEAELEADHWRWERTDEKRGRWDEGGAQTHFLYCAAWATVGALLVGDRVWGPPNSRAWDIFWVLFAVSLLSGLINNYRLAYSIAAEMKGHISRKLWKST